MKKHSYYLMKCVQKDLRKMTNEELVNLQNIFCNGWPGIGDAPGEKEESFSDRVMALNRTLNVVLYCYFWVWEKEDEETQLIMPMWTDKIDRKRQYYDTCRLLLEMEYDSDSAVKTAVDALTTGNKRITFL